MPWKPLSLGLTVLIVLMSGANAQSDQNLGECIADVARSDFSAKKAFQVGLHDLIVREKPKFAELADLNMRLQIALAQSRRMRIGHLLQTDLERLDTKHGMSRFTNFDWSAADTSALIQANARFEALTSEITGLKSRNNGHSDWPALRKFFAGELAQNPGYKVLLSAFQDARKLSGQRLLKCRA